MMTERGAFLIDQPKTSVLEVFPGPVLSDQGVNMMTETPCIPFRIPLELFDVLCRTQQAGSDGVIKSSPNL